MMQNFSPVLQQNSTAWPPPSAAAFLCRGCAWVCTMDLCSLLTSGISRSHEKPPNFSFGVFTGDSPDIGRGRKIYYIQHFSYRPPLQSFFFLNLKSSPRFHLFCFVCVFLLWSLFFTTSRANESHHPKTPTNPGAIWPNLDGRTSPLWLRRVRSEIT